MQDHSGLCPECVALPGECGEDCGQSEDEGDARVDLPRAEVAMVSVLDELLNSYLDDNAQPGADWSVETFKEAGVLTIDQGLVVKVAGSEFRLTVAKSR